MRLGSYVLVLALAALAGRHHVALADAAAEGTASWGVADGFRIDVDASGFVLPTAIAFVAEPGAEADDPRYFVTELRGAVKAVRNDGQVVAFFHRPTFSPAEEYPNLSGEGGLAGICLDPVHGYVYITYSYQDATGILRNGMSRLKSTPGSFHAPPAEIVSFDAVFGEDQAALSHQIGPCQVEGDALFVSVGDGASPTKSRDPQALLGKILRMTLDGLPYPGNTPGGEGRAAYVWALGLRNPFSLEVLEGKVYVADNGPGVDRFLRLDAGGDYLWNGTDWSIGSVADIVYSPAIGPVQMERYPDGTKLFPEPYRGGFFVALSAEEAAGVLHIPFDPGDDRSTGVSAYVAKGRAAYPQAVTGLAFGPDGLYFTSILPDESGTSPVLRLTHDPSAPHPLGLFGGGIEELVARYGCRSCHLLNGTGGQAGPSLDRNALNVRLRTRLASEEYRTLLAQLNQSNEASLAAGRAARKAVLDASGRAQMVMWVSNKLQQPGFDNPAAQMPNLGISKAEAGAIAAHLVGLSAARPWYVRILRDVFGTRRGLVDFALGVVGGFAAGFALRPALRRRRRDRAEAITH